MGALEEDLPQKSGEAAVEEQVLTRIQVREAMAKLGREEQEILLLRYVNELSAAVIGELLGISRFAAHRRIQGAVRRFKEAMEP